MNSECLKLLHEPFNESDLEWRIQQSGVKNGKPWARVLVYVTARAIMQRLDQVVGPANWQAKVDVVSGGFISSIGIKIDGEWVWKSDGATETEVSVGGRPDAGTNFKGGISGALKRSAVLWGIGRYLYDVGDTFAVITESGCYRGKAQDKEAKKDVYFKWNPPKLPAFKRNWFLVASEPDREAACGARMNLDDMWAKSGGDEKAFADALKKYAAKRQAS